MNATAKTMGTTTRNTPPTKIKLRHVQQTSGPVVESGSRNGDLARCKVHRRAGATRSSGALARHRTDHGAFSSTATSTNPARTSRSPSPSGGTGRGATLLKRHFIASPQEPRRRAGAMRGRGGAPRGPKPPAPRKGGKAPIAAAVHRDRGPRPPPSTRRCDGRRPPHLHIGPDV